MSDGGWGLGVGGWGLGVGMGWGWRSPFFLGGIVFLVETLRSDED